MLRTLTSLLLLCLAACCSQAFVLPSISSPPSKCSSGTPAFHKPRPAHKTVLYAHNSTDIALDGGLLTGDLVAIVVACQLIGLIDVLTDDSFWANGGFAQPVPTMPTTLGTFVQRTSTGCICWILASLTGSNQSSVSNVSKIAGMFALLQLGLAFGVASQAGISSNFDTFLVARDCYYAVILVAGWRYFASKMF